jgi:hypothetical protein
VSGIIAVVAFLMNLLQICWKCVESFEKCAYAAAGWIQEITVESADPPY